jgi:hypothetical protein
MRYATGLRHKTAHPTVNYGPAWQTISSSTTTTSSSSSSGVVCVCGGGCTEWGDAHAQPLVGSNEQGTG